MRKRLVAGALSLLLQGCLGQFEQTVFDGNDDESQPGDESGGNGGTGSHGQTQTCVGPAPVGRQPLRRLNRTELARSLEGLLGSAGTVYDVLPSDDAVLFDNDADALTVSPNFVEKLDDLITPLVAKALTPPASGGTGARERILVCTPASTAGETACARTILTAFARQAWRRPPPPGEVDSLLPLFQTGRSSGEPFEASLQLALRAVLLSPRFLYRIEESPGASVARVDDHALAVRLAYFLWSAPPDATLLQAADAGKLQTDEELAAQVSRMLRDPKARALTEQFGAQWLELRNLDAAQPSAQHYPGFDESLRTAMREETKSFFGAFVTADRSVLDLLDADFTFVNARLAQHYGMPAPAGTGMQEAKLPSGRVGLLTQASLLIGGSTPTRSSPTKRGRFVLERLLCRPPPPPPPNVAVEIETQDTNLPMRERLAVHRANPACAGCHAEMDPIGLAYEHFDGAGRYQETHAGKAIDTSGSLPGRGDFSGAAELAAVLKRDPEVSHCIGEQLFAYAMGRAPKSEDRCAIEEVVKRFEAGGHRFESLVLAIVQSESFRSRPPQSK